MSGGDETGCFTAEWNIVNFSLFSSAGEKPVRSPVFKTETTHGDSMFWRLLVYYSDSNVSFTMLVYNGSLEKGMCELLLFTNFGEVKIDQASFSTTSKKIVFSIKKDVLFGYYKHSYLLQDTLNIRIRIRQHEIKHGRSKFRTVLQTVNLAWNIEDFSCSTNVYRSLHQQGTLQLITVLHETNENGTHKLRIETLPNMEVYSTFVKCKLIIKDDHGHIISSNSIHPTTGWLWNIQLPNNFFNCNLRLYLQCLIAMESNYQPPSSTIATSTVDSIPADSSGETRSSSTHKEDFLFLYMEGLHSDAKLNAEQKCFPVHKSILSARSEVFRAMFEKDQTTEAISGMVNIDDIDSKTVERLLFYLYGDKFEDIQWEEASALYYAADKYAVHSLKKRCADLLKNGMTVSNVCHLLVLAENHFDEHLINVAVEFIRDHDEVISSTEWAQLEDNYSKLTTKVMRELYLLQRKSKTNVI